MRFLTPITTLILALILIQPMPVQAQRQTLPFLDQITSPLTESELGAMGCLVASAATGGILTYMMGGFSRIATNMQGAIPPLRVMEGAAAVSFIFSSVCYIGAAVAPMAMKAYASVSDRFDDDLPTFFTSEEMATDGEMGTGATVPGK
jgi:hypothetical protein